MPFFGAFSAACDYATVRNTFDVGDKYFRWSSSTSRGVRLADLRDGQPVTVRYQAQQKGYNDVEDMRVQH